MMDIKAITEVLNVFQKKIAFMIVFFVSTTLLFAAGSEGFIQDDGISQSLEKDTIGFSNASKVEIFVAKGASIINVDSIKGNCITYEKTIEDTAKNRIAKKSFQPDVKKIAQEYVKVTAKQLKVKISTGSPHSLLSLSLYIVNNVVIPSSQTQIKAVCYNEDDNKNIFFVIPDADTRNFGFANSFVIQYHSGYLFSRPPPFMS